MTLRKSPGQRGIRTHLIHSLTPAGMRRLRASWRVGEENAIIRATGCGDAANTKPLTPAGCPAANCSALTAKDYQVQIDHGDYWSESTDVPRCRHNVQPMNTLKGLAEEDWDRCSGGSGTTSESARAAASGEGYRTRARIKVVVEDCADKPNDQADPQNGRRETQPK